MLVKYEENKEEPHSMHTLLPSFRNRLRAGFARHGVALLTLTCLVLISYPTWLTPAAPGFDDLTRLNGPQRILLVWFYQHGYWPLWNPFNFGGQPFLAAGQSGPLYLPNIIFLLLPFVVALKVSYLFHTLLAAYGMYALVWHLTKSRLGSVVAAVSFVTCGFLTGHQIHTQMFDAFCWFPVCLWLLQRLLARPTPLRFAALAVSSALEVYAGHPQMTFYLFLTLGLYTLADTVQNLRWGQARTAASALCSLLVGLALSAPQWLPTVNLVSYSDRAAVSADFLLRGSMPPSGFVQFFSPFTAGGGYTLRPLTVPAFYSLYHSPLFWELTCYVGLAALAIATGTAIVLFRQSAVVRNLVAVTAVSVCLALGANGFLQGVLVHVPGFNLFRIPARYIAIADLSLAVLAGIGVARLCQDTAARLRKTIAVSALLYALIFTVVWYFNLRGTMPRMAVLEVYLVLGLLGFLLFFRHRPSKASAWLSAALAIAECTLQSASFSNFDLVRNPPYVEADPVVAYIQQHMPANAAFMRVADLESGPLSYDKSAAYQIAAVNGYDSLESAQYATHIGLTWDNQTLLSQPRAVLDAMSVRYVLTTDRSPLMPMEQTGISVWNHWVNVPAATVGFRIDVGPALASGETWGPLVSITLQQGDKAKTYQITGTSGASYEISLPKSFPTPGPVNVTLRSERWLSSFRIQDIQFLGANGSQADRVTVNKVFGPSPWKRVFSANGTTVWENPSLPRPAWVTPSPDAPLVSSQSNIKLSSWSPNRQEWNVSQGSAGWFVVSQTFDPNWHATVDGHPVAVTTLGSDYGSLLTGVQTAAGAHHIVLTYMPRSFQTGLAIAALATLFTLMLILRGIRKGGRSA